MSPACEIPPLYSQVSQEHLQNLFFHNVLSAVIELNEAVAE